MTAQEHWENVYAAKAPDAVSWYRPHLEKSLELVERAAGGNRAAAIADIGGGASTLVDDLVARGYGNLSVLDLSQRALDLARRRMFAPEGAVRWIRGDATQDQFPAHSIDVWHDRAVFHFLTREEERRNYVRAALRALRPGGHIIVSTFGPEGPLRCSGLETVRYDAGSLHGEFGAAFRMIESAQELHRTPWGSEQQFVYCFCKVGDLSETWPLWRHALEEAPAFTPQALMESVRTAREVKSGALPELCFLEFDGDLTDWLVAQDKVKPVDSWACFHTAMYEIELAGVRCGVVARTIGGPYAVLVAEQLAAAGVKRIVGLTSAGRISPELPLPCLVVASGAVRDEGTSLHYLAPGRAVECPAVSVAGLARALTATVWPLRCGEVWTTDAPYRETASQLSQWAEEGVLAVEMQAASLYAFGQARGVAVAVVCMVSNAVDHEGAQFDTGGMEAGMRVLEACASWFRG
jgi:uridine phosphorylase/SAM-dependent methyltransferase